VNTDNSKLPATSPLPSLDDPKYFWLELVFKKTGYKIPILRENLAAKSVGTYLGIAIQPSPAEKEKYGLPPCIVYQAVINEKLEAKQTGSGLPCSTKEHADEVLKIIEYKNGKNPAVGLMSWAGGFAIGEITKADMGYYDFGIKILKPSKRHRGKKCGFELLQYHHTLDNEPKVIKTILIPTLDKSQARAICREKMQKILDNYKKQKTIPPEAATAAKESEKLLESQLIVLSKVYPETAKVFINKAANAPEKVYEAFLRDNYIITGQLPVSIPFNQEQLNKIIRSAMRIKRGGKNSLDPIEVELVTGWFLKGYANMTPPDRQKAMAALGLNPPNADAIRKICSRLKLPAMRKPGKN